MGLCISSALIRSLSCKCEWVEAASSFACSLKTAWRLGQAVGSFIADMDQILRVGNCHDGGDGEDTGQLGGPAHDRIE